MDNYSIQCNYEAFKAGSCPRACSNGIFNALAIESSVSSETLTKAYSYLMEMLADQPESEGATKLLQKAIKYQSELEIAFRKMADLLLK